MGCAKDPEAPIELGYEYFRINTGHWVEYDVVEVTHNFTKHDTLVYQLREIVESTFTDNEGRPTQRIERYKRLTSSDTWLISDVWYSNRKNRVAEKVEENHRITKLAFPVKEGGTWDGHAENILDRLEYRYLDAGVSRKINGIQMSKTACVEQRYEVNLVQFEMSYETYAEGIGLVGKYEKVLGINNFDSLDINTGNELYLSFLSFGN